MPSRVTPIIAITEIPKGVVMTPLSVATVLPMGNAVLSMAINLVGVAVVSILAMT